MMTRCRSCLRPMWWASSTHSQVELPLASQGKRLERVLSFIGYGNPNAPVWFIGQEEGIPDDAGAREHLKTRATFTQYMDCRTAHAALGIHHLHGLEGTPVKVQRTWLLMSQLMLCIQGKSLSRKAIAEYQARSLGASDGSTLLAELMPLPKTRLSSCPLASFLDATSQLRSSTRSTSGRHGRDY